MTVLEIKENVFWVGVVDWNLRDFHGYALARNGTTYNSFLVKDEITALVDTVNSRFIEEFRANIKAVAQPGEIEYLIVNHVEPDHSGCLVDLVEWANPKKILCSAKGKEFMVDHYHRDDWPFHVVQTGDTLSLGKKTVQFIELKMLHWPDNLGSYLQEDRLLLSSDAFGHNWATSERFDDEVGFEAIGPHLAKYFANIILPYSGNVLKAITEIDQLGWDIDMIAPDHGLIFRTHVQEVMALYERFAKQEAGAKAVVIFDTMWESTRRMARSIVDGLIQGGVVVKLFDMKAAHHSDVMAELLDSLAVVVGSPTHNQGVLPYVAAMLRYMEGLKPRNRLGAAFGSYGWGRGEAVDRIEETMDRMKMEVVDSLKVKFVPRSEDLKRCEELGRKVAEAVKERQGGSEK